MITNLRLDLRLKLYYLHVCRDCCSPFWSSCVVWSCSSWTAGLATRSAAAGPASEPPDPGRGYIISTTRKIFYLSAISNNIRVLHLQSPSQSQSYLSISHLMLFLSLGFGLFAQRRQWADFFLGVVSHLFISTVSTTLPSSCARSEAGVATGPAQRQATVNTRPSVLQRKVGLRTEINFIVMN